MGLDFFKKKNPDELIDVHELSDEQEFSKDKLNVIGHGSNDDELNEGSITTATKYDHETLYPIESYLYYAILERRREWQDRKKSTVDHWLTKIDVDDSHHEKRVPEDAVIPRDNTDMLMRMANWWSVFFLITSDILGPSSAPYAFSTLGYGKGTIIYLVFYACAVYCGMLIWRQFLDLSSSTHPVRTFADLAYRIWGRPGKILVMLAHAIYLILAVSLLILGSAQGLSQIIKAKFCFVGLMGFFTIAGIGLGQIKTLKVYSSIASFSVFFTITSCCITMGGVANFKPNYSAAYTQDNVSYGPLKIESFIGGGTMMHQLNGVMNIVYAYAGSIMFPEILAEMQHPWDFWKGAAMAQTLIFIAYLFYGVFVYCFQGQFVINPANQGVSNYPIQTVTNIISLFTGMVAAGLYMHVGLKSMYQNLIVDLFHGPKLGTKGGKIFWVIFAILYWILSFVIAGAVPQLSNVAAISAAVCALQFTYSFPALMTVTLQMRKDALLGDSLFDPQNDRCERSDTWLQFSRWKRGFMKQWHWNTFNFLLGLASLSLAALGIWSSIESIITTFAASGSSPSFSCQAPV